jgi:hypothetical protein
MLLLATTDLPMGEDGFLLAKLCKQHVEMKCTLFARPDTEQNNYKGTVSHGGVGYPSIYAALMQSLTSLLSAGLDCKYYILFCVNDFKLISNLLIVIKKIM